MDKQLTFQIINARSIVQLVKYPNRFSFKNYTVFKHNINFNSQTFSNVNVIVAPSLHIFAPLIGTGGAFFHVTGSECRSRSRRG